MPRVSKEETGTILAEYMRRVDAGEVVDVEAICESHPEIAEELRSYVAGAAMVDGLLQVDTSRADAHQETLKPGAAHATDSELIGQMFGRYKIERQLGQGAMGAVYLAHDTNLDRQVALKIPKFAYGEQQEFMTRFQREAQAAANLNHAGICPVFDFGEENGSPYITMAYIDGQPLSRYVGTTQATSEWVAEMIRQIADALSHAHDSGVVHRDLKAGNVLIDTNGKAIITDFGLACKVDHGDESRITKDGAILGTPGYMSPEQVEADLSKIGPPTDIYALGVMLFELLTGELPFRGALAKIFAQISNGKRKDPRDLNPNADARLSELTCQLMSKEIADRPANMHAVVEILRDWQSGPSAADEAEQKKKQEKLDKLEAAKQKVGDLISRAQYAQATSLLEQISSVTDADGVGYATWAREELKRVEALPKKVREGVPALVATAKKLIRKHDYGQAAEMLHQVPREMRTPELNTLLEKAIDRQDEVDLLLADLQECVRKKQYNGIKDNVKRLLKIKPNNRFAKNLWEALNTYSSTPTGSRKYRFDEKGKLLPQQAGMNTTLIGLIVFGVLVFGAMSYAMTIYLKSGNQTLTVKVDDELLRNGDITFTFDGEEHVITGPEFRLTVSPGAYGYEVRQGNTIIRNPDTFIVTSNGRNVLEIGTENVAKVPRDQDAYNYSLRFKYDHVKVPSMVYDGSTPLTVEAWMKPSNQRSIAAVASFCSHIPNAGIHCGVLPKKDGTLRPYAVCLNDQIYEPPLEAKLPIEKEEWMHLAVTRDKNIIQLFVDGILCGRKVLKSDYQPAKECLYIGAVPHVGEDGFKLFHTYFGEIDEVRISKSVRYKNDFTPQVRMVNDQDTLALYHFDEGRSNILKDSSGNGHHGTIVAPKWEVVSGMPIASSKIKEKTPLPDGPPGLVKSFDLGEGGVSAISVSPDGRIMVAGGGGRKLHLWDIETGNRLWAIPVGASPIQIGQTMFTDNGNEILVSGQGGTIEKLDTQTGNMLLRYAGHPVKTPPKSNTISVLEKLPDTSGFVTVARNGTVAVWDFDRSKPKHYFDLDLESWDVNAGVAKSGLVVSRLNANDEIRHISLQTGKTLRTYGANFNVASVNALTDKFLKHEFGSPEITVVDISTGNVERSYKTPQSNILRAMFTPDGRHAIAATREPAIRIWEIASGKEIAAYPQPRHSHTMTCTPDGRFLFFGDQFGDDSGNNDSSVNMWRLPQACWTNNNASAGGPNLRDKQADSNTKDHVSRTTPLQAIGPDPFAGKQLKDRWSKNFLNTTFLWIPPGKFRMGSSRDAPLDRHEQPVDVEISHGLWVQQMELTQGEWKKLVGLTPWMPFADKQANDRNAATHMTWDEAVDFCQRLTDRDRRLENIPNDWEYRLPSEAEWEYFCRAGTTTTFSFGDDVRELGKYAWWKENTQDKGNGYAHKVGQLPPNPWGLFDVHGNVFEFCYDSFVEQLPGGRDPVVANPPIAGKIARGGGWAYVGADAHESGSRDHQFARNVRRNRVGMRLVLAPVSEISAVGFGRQATDSSSPAESQKVIGANDWQVFPKESAGDWRFSDSTLTAVTSSSMSVAYFNKTYEEFELTMDVRSTDTGNGGILLRAARPHATFQEVLEVDIVGGNDADHPSGGIYLSDEQQPATDPGGDRDWTHSLSCVAQTNAFHTGEWNRVKIRLVDQLLTVEINDQLTFWRLLDDLTIAFPHFTEAVAPRKGYIGLQAFLGTVQYRDIHIQPLR